MNAARTGQTVLMAALAVAAAGCSAESVIVGDWEATQITYSDGTTEKLPSVEDFESGDGTVVTYTHGDQFLFEEGGTGGWRTYGLEDGEVYNDVTTQAVWTHEGGSTFTFEHDADLSFFRFTCDATDELLLCAGEGAFEGSEVRAERIPDGA